MLPWFDNAGTSTWALEWLIWLIDSSIKTTVVLTIALFCVHMLRRSDARVRQALWSAALLGTLAMPIVSCIAPAWHLGLWPAPTARAHGILSATAPADAERPEPLLLMERPALRTLGPGLTRVEPDPIRRDDLDTESPAPAPALATQSRTPWAEFIVVLWLT
ncbi:MAG: hypothetical protein JSU86_15455, partial [Phycisphaerales bacterium]